MREKMVMGALSPRMFLHEKVRGLLEGRLREELERIGCRNIRIEARLVEEYINEDGELIPEHYQILAFGETDG